MTEQRPPGRRKRRLPQGRRPAHPNPIEPIVLGEAQTEGLPHPEQATRPEHPQHAQHPPRPPRPMHPPRHPVNPDSLEQRCIRQFPRPVLGEDANIFKQITFQIPLKWVRHFRSP